MATKTTTATSIALCLLREHRIARGLQQVDISKAIGITASAYCKIENGKTPATLGRVISVARMMNIHASTLLDQQEKIAILLAGRGWMVVQGELGEGVKDSLLTEMEVCTHFGFTKVEPMYGFIAIPSVIASIIGREFDTVEQTTKRFIPCTV